MASLKDILQRGVISVLEDEVSENGREHSEGPAELANPKVIPQPVRNSATPQGQPLNFLSFFSQHQGMLLLIFGGLLALGVGLFIFKHIKG